MGKLMAGLSWKGSRATSHPANMRHVRKPQLAWTAAVILCLLSGSPALAAGDVAAGQELARRWCAGCHVIDRSRQGSDAAPPFVAIARQNPETRGWLRAWLTAPHPPMPNFNLSRRQIDDIIAYLDSLSPR